MSERASSAEFIWTGDLSWRSGHKIDLTPRLQNAYQTAVDGLAEACFDVTGNKTVYVKRVPVGKHHLGAAHNADAFSLVLDRQSATNSRYNFGFLENVRVIAHELTHQERMKHVPFDKTLTERLATEGLAILAESLVHGMLDPASITEVDRYLYTGSNYWKWKLCEFFADVQDVTESTSTGGSFDVERSVYSKWFQNNYEGYGLGAWVVCLNYVEDEDFGRILKKPTSELLDVL